MKGEGGMGKGSYITDEERKKCQKVAEAFEEVYERTDIAVIDAGKYGFVKLQYYKLPVGFDSAVTYRNSESLFNDLWFDWMYDRLLATVQGTPLVDLDYKEIYKRLPKEKQEEIIARRDYFREMSGVELSRKGNL